MNFRDWYYGHPPEQRAELAQRLDASEGYLNMIAGGFRRAGESLAIKVERESAGLVTVEEQRPDVPWEVIRGSNRVTA